MSFRSNEIYSINSGSTSTSPYIPYVSTVNPSNLDINFPLYQVWINSSTGQEWILLSFSQSNGTVTANWNIIPGITTLTGTNAVAVNQDSNGNVNILGGAGVTVTGNETANSLTISVSDLGLNWSTISADQTLVVDNGYFCTGGAVLNLALPAVSALGDTIIIYLDGSSGFTITQAALQQIRLASKTSTAGVGGSLSSTAQGDSVTLVCRTANLVWTVIASNGNLTIV
ncbi:MAG: hypothetical protein KGI50_05235 [Patescibacteria group bacterium]|nr:hypothetical protein [Patescibacteria group bacterium]MDE2438737.1 hypothetical protein [Patescibacteria group bacterium]